MIYRKNIIATTDTSSHFMNKTDSNYYKKTCRERKVCSYYCHEEQKHNNETTGIQPICFDFHSFQQNF